MWRIAPSGDRCLIVEFDSTDLARANRFACVLANRLIQARVPGVTDVVPSLAAVGVHYDPAAVIQADRALPPWDALVARVGALIPTDDVEQIVSAREVVIPVCYGGDYGEDLTGVAQACGLTPREVISLHSGSVVSVLMIGFAPGHPYIGMFDERLAIPRRATPRTAVPSGSIGLANRQTVIYPMTLPGGWSLIGRTPLKLFDPYRAMPCLLNAGDRIRFQPITSAEFADLEHQQESVGEH